VARHADRAYVIEAKIKASERSRAKSLKQLEGYMDRPLAKEGRLVVLDRAPGKSWAEKIAWEDVELAGGRASHVVGCRAGPEDGSEKSRDRGDAPS
jgi:hypothetical protein